MAYLGYKNIALRKRKKEQEENKKNGLPYYDSELGYEVKMGPPEPEPTLQEILEECEKARKEEIEAGRWEEWLEKNYNVLVKNIKDGVYWKLSDAEKK